MIRELQDEVEKLKKELHGKYKERLGIVQAGLRHLGYSSSINEVQSSFYPVEVQKLVPI